VFVGQAWPHTTGWFPEESTEDPQWSVGVGYGEGKYVAERVGATFSLGHGYPKTDANS
jgi:hypothetical protein